MQSTLKERKNPNRVFFLFYPQLEKDDWIRMDIHRRENLTQRRFMAIIGGLAELIKNTDKKVVLVLLNATVATLKQYDLEFKLQSLAQQYPDKFLMTPLWKEYAHVIEFLDSGRCWAEMTDSGSMQEELLYFPKVTSMTVRLNTDRPETIFEAQSNMLVPPLNAGWIVSMVKEAYNREDGSGAESLRHKKQIYGKPGTVSKNIIRII